MKDLSIIIPVFNNCQFTQACLKDLARLELDYEVVVVDNNSEDRTAKIVSESEANVIYVKNSENYGFSKANNIGYAKSSGKNVLFLNNDIRVESCHEDWPQHLVDTCKDGIVGVLCGRINQKYDPVGEGLFDPNMKGAYLSGWCVLAKRDTWDKLIIDDQNGPWNEDYFLYYEDDDLSFRAKKQGIPLILSQVPVHHYSRVTGKRFNMFHFLRKSKRIFKKNWPEIV